MSSRSERHGFVVEATDHGLRLDQALAARIPGMSRRRARVLIDLGGVFVDGRRMKVAGRPVRRGEKIVANAGGALDRATKRVGGEARASDDARLPPYTILFEDQDLVVVEKPAGLLTAPTPESDRGNLANLLGQRAGSSTRIFVVHRLDLPTSGVLVFAKNDETNRALSERFRLHDLEREYLGVVAGAFPEELRVLETPVGGRPARTHVQVDERFEARATRLRFRLETGRTHQIRIHCQVAGYPILGDNQYGRPAPGDPPRMALHAARLAFPHPRTAQPLDFESAWPADLTPWLEALRAGGPVARQPSPA